MTDHKKNRFKQVSRAAIYGSLHALYRAKKRWFVAAQCLLAVLVIVQSILLQTYFQLKPPNYELMAGAKNLIGDSREDTNDYLKYDETKNMFSFEVPKSKANDNQGQHFGREDDGYTTTLSKDAKNGITYTDTKNNIAITVSPQFFTAEGRKVNGDHIVYPAGSTQLVYTHKFNGLKEDIVVPKYTANEQNYEFTIALPVGVEARLDNQGSIGIYSADTALYGNISFGSDEDRAKVDKAREKSEKTNLVATIPFPIVKDSAGKEYTDKATFQLGSMKQERAKDKTSNKNLPAEVQAKMEQNSTHNVYDLSVQAKDLEGLSYPISIDPTIQTSSNNDFAKGRFVGTETDPDDTTRIQRAGLRGGAVDSWASAGTDFSTGRANHAVVAHNGYLYYLGGGTSAASGENSGQTDTVEYAAINSNGTIGSWTATTVLPQAITKHAAVVWNGFIYVTGGYNGTSRLSNVYYAPILRDGSLGSWTLSGNTFTNAREFHTTEVTNGYLYITGGWNGSTYYNDIQYAALNGDGSTGTWTTNGTSFTVARRQLTSAIYNGYIYILGGYQSASATTCKNSGTHNYCNDVQYATINSDGSVGTWVTSTNYFATTRLNHGTVVSNGYIYVIGGYDQSGNFMNDTQYAPLQTDGNTGAWQSSSTFTNPRRQHKTVAYHGRIYLVGGFIGVSTNYADTQYTTLKAAGEVHNEAFTVDGDAIPIGGHVFHTTVAYNGYLYVLGGCLSTDCSAVRSDKARYAAINDDGSIGAFTNDGDNIPVARWGHASVAYDGYLYIIGGCGATASSSCSTFYDTVYYSQIGTSGNPGAWSTDSTNRFSTARMNHTAVAHNGFVYVIGGCSATSGGACTTYHNDVQVAPINSSGDFGTFTAEDSFTTARFSHTSVAVNGYLYILGGYSGSFHNDVQRSAIASDGTIGSFSSTTSFTTARYQHGTYFDKGYMYVTGGCSALTSGRCSTFESDIQYAIVNDDGTVGSWTSTQGITTGNLGHGMAIYSGFLYITGGCTAASSGSSFWACTTYSNQIKYQQVNNGGSGAANAWQSSSTLPVATRYGGSVAYNGYIYFIGGDIAAGAPCVTENVYRASIDNDGTLGTWSSSGQAALGNKRARFGLTLVGNYIYVIGGMRYTNCGNAAVTTYTSVEYAAIDGSGNVGTWTTNASEDIPAFLLTPVATTYNGYLYVLGGTGAGNVALDQVLYALPSGSGSLATDAGCGSEWCTTTVMPGARTNGATTVYRGYIYYIAGVNGTGGTFYSDVFYAPLNANGTAGTWATGPPIASPRRALTTTVLNGYIYAIGGEDTSVSYSDIQFAALLPNGRPDIWQTSASKMAAVRSWFGGTTYNGFVYVIGGQNTAGTVQSTSYLTSLRSISRKGTYTRYVDFGAGVKPTKLITRGTKRTDSTVALNYQSVNNSSATFSNSQSSSDISYAGANALTFSLGSNVTLSRYLLLSYTIDESQSAVFPDYGNETTITDFDIYFKANPGQRLRGGRTFTGGADRGLDAQP